MSGPMVLDIRDLSCGYGSKMVLSGLSLKIAKGEFTGIIGPNGSGKTTLFRCLSRSLVPAGGVVLLKGRDIRGYTWNDQARTMAVLPQTLPVPYDFSVEEFVMMGRFPYLERFKPAGKRDKEALERSLRLTDTDGLRDRSVLRLSGGEQQRVFLAQALCQEPGIILLDEPTSHLDIGHQKEVMDLLLKLNRTAGLTVLAVLHDLNLASAYCSRVVLLDAGRIASDGPAGAVLKKSVLEKVYGTRISVTRGSSSGRPAVFVSPG